MLCCMVSCQSVDKQPTQGSKTEKPWAYWWWHGSSVTREGISANLEAYAGAGMGGLHIIPIYGVMGDEDHFIDFLSPKWMEMLGHTVSEAERLGMGIDMTSGTGWPFGGPGISYDHAAKTFLLKEFDETEFPDIRRMTEETEGAALVCLSARTKDGKCENITSFIRPDGEISGDLSRYEKCYALVMRPTGQKVKRAAPGGEGLVMDYFSKDALDFYFERFKAAFSKTKFAEGKVRAFYNDSYEVYGANFTVNFPEKFRMLRGYDLAGYLDILADTSGTETRERVVTDYCETVSDLIYAEFTKNWVAKSHETGMLTRNQAHGSPGNILDLYGEADIPETESFGASGFSIPGLRVDPGYEKDRFGRPNPLAMKFASSAAHLNGRQLVSSETATWLGDHFKVALSQIKPQIDELFTAGINHIFYHGITYNPPEVPFPGRLFYASTNFGTRSHFQDELPALNKYVERCQSVLQKTAPDHDILLYFPIHDIWAKKPTKQLIRLFTVHHTREWLEDTSFGEVAGLLWQQGFTFDYISDRLLDEAGDRLTCPGGNRCKTIVVPKCTYIPEKTLETLLGLVEKGARVIFCGRLPESVPGLGNLEKRQEKLAGLKKRLTGKVSVTNDILPELLKQGVRNEEMTSAGLRFIRKRAGDETVYFVSNLSGRFHKGKILLSSHAAQVEIFDPLTGQRGLAASSEKGDRTEVLLHLEPGMSCFLTCRDKKGEAGQWPYFDVSGNGTDLSAATWTVTPASGAPLLPAPAQTGILKSWVEFGPDWRVFSGKAVYSAVFDTDDAWLGRPVLLDLGDVRETAKITINGQEAGLLWCIPYKTVIPPNVLKKSNTIEIEVANLSFNRVIDLDKRKVPWKNFHEINFVDIQYKPYDASDKEPVESGLLGPVRFLPMKSTIQVVN